MDKLIKPGRIIFAIGFLALGILCILSKDFIIGRPPAWPAGFLVNPALAYTTGAIVILAALAIIFARNSSFAALIIAILIFLCSVLRHLPQFLDDWLNSFKSMALFGGALIVASSYLKKEDYQSRLRSNNRLIKSFVVIGFILNGAFFIACGYAHFKFSEFIDSFIPSYIPFHSFWTYFCGICLFAGGIGILIPQTRRWAAFLSGLMVLGWFIFLHIPRFMANPHDLSDRMGLFESLSFAGIFFVLAGLYPDRN